MERYPKKRNPAETLAELKRVADEIRDMSADANIRRWKFQGYSAREILLEQERIRKAVERAFSRKCVGVRFDCISGLLMSNDD